MGAVHVKETVPFPDEPATEVGSLGTATGMIACDVADGFPSPTLFVAVTTNVYDVPLVRPCTSHVKGPLVQRHVNPPGVEVTV